MNSELEVLKKFWENNGKTHIRLISYQTGLGIDYTRYICNCLLKKSQLKPLPRKRDWYRITSQGKKELKLQGIIKPKVPRKVSGVEKVIYYFPKKLKAKPSKVDFQEPGVRRPKGKLIESEEKKLNLGRAIEKTVSFLRRI